jgi:hypothetical protein
VKRYKLPVIDQLLKELMQRESKILCSEIHKLTHSCWNKEELSQQCKELIIVPMYEMGKKSDW